MKSVAYEEFLRFRPCWLEEPEKARKLEETGRRKERWTALDVLDLPEEEVSGEDKLWAVLREEFIEPELLHEFACRCAEMALALEKKPDPRSAAAVEAKRRWLRGEIGSDELGEALDAALAAARAAARDAALDAAWDAARAAARDAARAAAWDAALAAAWDAATDAAWDAATDAAWDAARNKEIEILKSMLGDSH